MKFVSEPSEAEKGNAEREAFYRAIDAQFAGLSGDALYPGWRDDLYDTARENEPTGAARAA
ncbi:MAG: hypothetical protein ACKVOP_03165 [Sphingomonadaceae bacterium]